MTLEYLGLREIAEPIVIIEGVKHAAYDEIVEIRTFRGTRMGRVIRLDGNTAVVLVFEGTQGLSTENTVTRFTGKPMTLGVSQAMLGRTFDGMGKPADNAGTLPHALHRNINSAPTNPLRREPPHMPLLTGFSAIDALITLVRGQKLPIFSADGLPHERLAADLTAQFLEISGEDAVVVFAAMGIKRDTADFFRVRFEESGALFRTVSFLNLADDPPAARIITPRLALTAAEFFAHDCGRDVLVILTDMTAYAEALRAIAAARGEIPGRRGYPGYLYSDLASLYERAGTLRGQRGAVTLMPILTMPDDDITHPVADLTGFITEGQIVLDRALHNRGIYPPVAILPSLSRLMKDAIGKGKTHPNHPKMANQLAAAYAQVADTRMLRSIVGEDDLNEADRKILAFGEAFEQTFLHQAHGEIRTLEQTMAVGEKILKGITVQKSD